MVQYFAATNGLKDKIPLLKLQSPSARSGTNTSSFGVFPWSGGEKGTVKFFDPGSKIMVRWQIESPTKDGKCAIRLAEQNDQNEGSYKFIRPENLFIDEQSGFFTWGNLDGNPEGVEIIVPSSLTCTECTLQFIYKSTEYGNMYQCSDISVAAFDNTNDCDKPWQNGGIETR